MSKHFGHIKALASLTIEDAKVEVAQNYHYKLKSYQVEDLREMTHYFPRSDKTMSIYRIFINDTDSLGLKNVGWVITDLIPRCMACSKGYSLKKTRHHCRACGNLVCNKCSNYENTLIGYEHLGPQKVCQSCYRVSESFPHFPFSGLKNRIFHFHIYHILRFSSYLLTTFLLFFFVGYSIIVEIQP